MPVVLIGDSTYGKPVGQYLVEFCGKVLAPVSFSLTNANGDLVQGWTATDGAVNTSSPLGDLRIPVGDVIAPEATTSVTFGGNLPADAPSVAGTRVLQRHFPAGVMGPVAVLLVNPRVDFAGPEGRAVLGELTERLADAFFLKAKVTVHGKLAVRFDFACTLAPVTLGSGRASQG